MSAATPPIPTALPAPLPAVAWNLLAGYPQELLAQVGVLIAEGRLAQVLKAKYPEPHEVRTDRALYDYVQALKNRCMRSSPPLAMVQYDPKLRLVSQALGTHTTVSRV